MPSIQLPFPGFYESILSGEVDRETESLAEHLAEQEVENYPAEIRLSAHDTGEFLWEHICYRKVEEKVSREYVASMEHVLSERLGFKFPLKFEEMTSPKFYNFETDRLFAATTHKAIKALWKASKADKYVTLAAVITDRHTSCSGFHSFYSNELRDWLAKPVREWDHNQLETLLLAGLKLAGTNLRTFTDDVVESMYGNNDFGDAVDAGLNWETLAAEIARRRSDLIVEYQLDHPEYVIPYRCPVTPDLFADTPHHG